ERDGEALVRERGRQQVLLVLPPRGGVGAGGPVGGPALALCDAVDHPPDEPRRQVLRGPRPARDHHRRRVTDAALELADDPVRIGQGAPLGGLADHDRAVLADEHDRRDGGAAAAEGDDLRVPPAVARGATHRGTGERRPQVDPELVRHCLTPHPDDGLADRPHHRIGGSWPVLAPSWGPYWTKDST